MTLQVPGKSSIIVLSQAVCCWTVRAKLQRYALAAKRAAPATTLISHVYTRDFGLCWKEGPNKYQYNSLIFFPYTKSLTEPFKRTAEFPSPRKVSLLNYSRFLCAPTGYRLPTQPKQGNLLWIRIPNPSTRTVEARKLEHHYPRFLKVKYRESQQETSKINVPTF